MNPLTIDESLFIGSDIYDRAIIRLVGDFAQIQLKVGQWLDKLRVHKIRKIDR